MYFFGYKKSFCSFKNNPKNLDPSYMTNLDLRDCLGRVKLVLQQNFVGRTDLVIQSNFNGPSTFGTMKISSRQG